MSAYIVDDITINKIVSAIRYAREYGGRIYPQPWKASLLEIDTQEQAATLAQNMFKMNCHAVDCRYGKNEAEKFRPLDFEYRSVIFSGKVKVYKALRCFLYQCAAGDAPEQELFKQLESYGGQLASAIVESLPEYELSDWG